MDDMASAIERRIQQLRSLPAGVHWFCPRLYDGDHRDFSDVDGRRAPSGPVDQKSNKEKLKLVEESKKRTETAMYCLRIFTMEGESVAGPTDWFKRRLGEQMIKCDICVGRYHLAKKRFLETLAGEHDDDEVAMFAKFLAGADLARIRSGLLTAAYTLRAAPPQERKISLLHGAALYGLFEALSCDAVLEDEGFMRAYLDDPLTLVQTKRTLRVLDYVPAMGQFVFDRNDMRRSWALKAFYKIERAPTKDEFWWALQEPLANALQALSSGPHDDESLMRVWNGIKAIVNTLSGPGLIRDGLRALDTDIYRLAMDHLQVDSSVFSSVLQTFRTLLRHSPADFADAMGAISPASVVEAVCNAPRFPQMLAGEDAMVSLEKFSSTDSLGWIAPLMESLQPANQPLACRALAGQLMDRFQAKDFPDRVRMRCVFAGLQVLSSTLRTFVDRKVASGGAVERVVIADMLEVVAKRIDHIIAVGHLPPSTSDYQQLSRTAMNVIRNVLALDCDCLRADYETLVNGHALQVGQNASSQTIWSAVGRAMTRNSMLLARNTLVALVVPVGLEKFLVNEKTNHAQDQTRFNDVYDRLLRTVSDIFERLSDFDPDLLGGLFERTDTSSALVAGLFSADQTLYGTAVEVIKVVSAQSGRREALAYLLQTYFETIMTCGAWTIKRIGKRKTFASNPRMLKTCGDMLDILCNSQDGIFTTRTLTTGEVGVVQSFWQYLWLALANIFRSTEAWGHVHERVMMQEFCRDVMQFADRCFEQYAIFASAIDAARTASDDKDVATIDQTKSTGQRLLEHAGLTLQAVAKWLRLRDEYLAEMLVGLVCKMLRRLEENRMRVAESTMFYIEDIAVRNAIRTILSPTLKTELGRALDEHLHRQSRSITTTAEGVAPQTGTASLTASEPPNPFGAAPPANAQKIDLDKWRSSSKLPTEKRAAPPRDEILANSSSVERFKLQAKRQSLLAPPSQARQMFATTAATNAATTQAQKEFREKRERDKQEKIARDKEQAARLRKEAAKSSMAGIAASIPTSSMMVSSESEPDSDQELDRELFGIEGPKKQPAVATDAHPLDRMRALQQTLPRGPVKKIKQFRNAKDMRARLTPDMSPLHKRILSWDFFHQNEFPPDSKEGDYSLVSSRFRTPMEYQATFKPLLILEAWQSFVKAKEEASGKPFEVKVATRATVDAFIEIGSSMPPNTGKDLGLGEADIILMSKGVNPVQEPNQPHCLARIIKVVRKKTGIEITYRLNAGNPLMSSLGINAVIRAVKVDSITPLEREYAALLGLQYYDLCDEIINARPSPLLKYTEQQLASILKIYNLNLAQSKAVRSAIDNDAFTLIQGPPGSGKTKTIVAIVGALLTGTVTDQGVAINRPGNLPSSRAVNQIAPKKLLVCAPSNAAVDELVMRFKAGVKTLDGKSLPINVVRLGRTDAVNSQVLDVTLDELINKRLDPTAGKTNYGEEIHKLVEETRALGNSLELLRQKLTETRAAGKSTVDLDRQYDVEKRKKGDLGKKIDELRDKSGTASRDAEINRRRVQQAILDGAHIICSTLSGSGHEMFHNLKIEFDTVVIDEAAQSIELSALIPLKYGCSKCILVGDPKQLPPTVLSREAARFSYEQSLFVRMQTNHPDDVHLLDTQYRMHPEISQFPSQAFYDGRLLDGAEMASLRQRPWHRNPVLGPYQFFDVDGQHQSATRGHSLVNRNEVFVALQIFDRLRTDHTGYDYNGKIGIITPYKGQLLELKIAFKERYGDSIFQMVEFNTTDAFQGRESEIIIFSCVRASASRGIGFLDDIRRMNVGLTRAKCSLWVLGNSRSLQQNEFWGRLIDDARRRNRYRGGDVIRLLQTPFVDTGGDNSSRAGGSAATTSKPTDEVYDVAMTDAPTPVEPTSNKAVTGINSATLAPDASSSTDAGKKPGVDQRNVIPDNMAYRCGICGSSAHFSYCCDNLKAREGAYGVCWRCGAADHIQARCAAPLCTVCGGIGHTKVACVDRRPLSKSDQFALIKREKQHEQRKQAYVEKQRQRQIGDHDPKVPIIRASSKTPPLEEYRPAEKRKRAPSDSHSIPHRPAPGPGWQTGGPSGGNNGAGPSGSGPQAPSNGAPQPQAPGSGPKPPGWRGPAPRRPPKKVDPFIRPKKPRHDPYA